MTLRTMLGFSDSHLIEDTTTDAQRAATEEEVRQAHLKAARRNTRWSEVEEVDLVPRGRGLFVAASSDAVYRPYAGAAFVSDHAPLTFCVTDAGELRFFERLAETWTEQLERKAERERRRAAPKQRPAWMNQ